MTRAHAQHIRRFWHLSPMVLFLLAGCSSYDPEWVAGQWSQAMNTLNISPVYPPTEDLHVGDIYAAAHYPEGKDEPKLLAVSTKYWYYDETYWLKLYYDSLPVMPDTGDPPVAGKIWQQTLAGAAAPSPAPTPKTPAGAAKHKAIAAAASPAPPANVFDPVGTIRSLPLEAFPGFTLSHADAESFSVSIPGEVLSALFGFGRKHQDATSVKILEAETYGIPEFVAQQHLYLLCQQMASTVCAPEEVKQATMELTGKEPSSLALYLVYRVYLARSIEYTYDSSTVLGAEGQLIAKLKTAITKANASNATQATNTQTGTSTDASTNKTTATTASTAQQQLDAELSSIDKATSSLGGSAPGATFSIGTANDAGISLIQTFQRPVVIGYRAAQYPISPGPSSPVPLSVPSSPAQ